jgi:hypothetical protein
VKINYSRPSYPSLAEGEESEIRRQQAVGMAKGESSKIGSEWKTSQGLCKRKIKGESEEESCPKETLHHGSLRENTARERRKYGTIARDNHAFWQANS